MSLISIPIPADATVPEALKAANRELGVYAREHRRPTFGWRGPWFPRTHFVRFGPDAVVYEVEDVCCAPETPQAAGCCVA